MIQKPTTNQKGADILIVDDTPANLELLTEILKAEGYKLAVASNSVRNSIEVMMQKCNLRPYLDVLVSNQDVHRAKPDPEIYEKTLTLLGVRPEEALVLEDNEHGIAAAKAAGAHLMIVDEVTDVTYDNIRRNIDRAEVAT